MPIATSMIPSPKFLLLVTALSPIVSAGAADKVKVLSVSPDKKIEIITKVGADHHLSERIRPHAKEHLLGTGIFARFIGSDSPPSVLWNEGESSSEADVEWDSSSTRVFIRQGDEKVWDSRLFVLRQDVRTRRLLFVEPRLPELISLLSSHTEISFKDKQGPWQSGIYEWRDAEKVILSLHLEDGTGWIAGKESCHVRFHFATKDLHHITLTKIDYYGVLPSEAERWYDEGEPPYREKVKPLYTRNAKDR